MRGEEGGGIHLTSQYTIYTGLQNRDLGAVLQSIKPNPPTKRLMQHTGYFSLNVSLS